MENLNTTHVQDDNAPVVALVKERYVGESSLELLTEELVQISFSDF